MAPETHELGPCVWWVRNDLRIRDNPALRAVNGASLVDKRPFVAVYVFDPRSVGRGAVGAAAARFLLQSVLGLRDELAARGSKLIVCHGRPEDLLSRLPRRSEVKCQNEPCSVAGVHLEKLTASALLESGSKLRLDPGAAWLVHPHEWPYGAKSPIGAGENQQFPKTLGGVAKALGYTDINASAEQKHATVERRPCVPAPSCFSAPPVDLPLPGLLPQEMLADEAKVLQHFGFSAEDIATARSQQSLHGGERAARSLLDQPNAMVDSWKELSRYIATGCLSAREVYARAEGTAHIDLVARQLVAREFRKLHSEPEEVSCSVSEDACAEPVTKKQRTETQEEPRDIPKMSGPVVWWVRNDLRVQDNPVVRAVDGAALSDARPFVAVFVFDPRFLDRSPYGRVTDPEFKNSIATRKAITFSSRKTNALRARFWLDGVKRLGEELAARGSKLLVCYGKPEDVLAGLPNESEVKCQSEPVSIEQTDVEEFTAAALQKKGSKLRLDPGAMSLYHPDDLPFGVRERPENYSELGHALGWKDIWTSAKREDWAAPIRPCVPAPAVFPAPPHDLQLPGLIPPEVLVDETKTLQRLGYTDEEIKEAQAQPIPQGGEPAARAHLEAWAKEQHRVKAEGVPLTKAVYWDLPCAGQNGAGAAHDPFQWANLSTSNGWFRISHYMAIGCISAREIYSKAMETPCFAGAAHRLLWRDFHRLYAQKYHRQIAWQQGPAKVKRSWSQDPEVADAWKKGMTGVPYIDACQRELNKTGWHAYKGRKTTAHFLVHDLGMDWRIGAFHHEETLLDYDFAMNYGNWAVVAKIGNGGSSAWDGSRDVDAEHWDLRYKLRAEQENDPTGTYIRRWVPELRNVDDKHIHTPWTMTEDDMKVGGCVLGQDYPTSLVGALDIAGCTPSAPAGA